MASRQPARNAHGLLYRRLKAHAELHPEHHGVGHHPRAAGLDDVWHGASLVCLPVTVTKTSDHRLSFSTQRLLCRASGSLDRRPTGGTVGPLASTVAPWGARCWCSSAWPALLGPPPGNARPVPAWGDGPSRAQPVAEEGHTRGGGSRQGTRAHVPIPKAW
jgi:hypothetical protein